MITFEVVSSGVKVVQTAVSPMIYLDHWAWRHFSASPVPRSRLVKALQTKNGTVALSWLNLIEFSKLTDQAQIEDADKMLKQFIPSIYFLEPDFGKVMEREDALISGASSPVQPHSDMGILKYFAKEQLTTLNPDDLFRLANATGLAKHFDSFADSALVKVEAFRKQVEQDLPFQAAVKKLPHYSPSSSKTRVIVRELLGSILLNKAMKIDRSDVVDISHATVAIAYCDYVLLDRRWEAQANVLRGRLKKAGITLPVAKVFSQKNNGIENFLGELESS